LKKRYFLREDWIALHERIQQLSREVAELGLEQGEANRQSTENFGHDDACQEAVQQKRTLIVAQINNLTAFLENAYVFEPKGPFERIRLGATIDLDDGRKFKIGSYGIFAQHSVQTISYDSPLARMLLGKAEGDSVEYNNKKFVVVKIA
jgi:transcription elongation GreA/GreB family factor